LIFAEQVKKIFISTLPGWSHFRLPHVHNIDRLCRSAAPAASGCTDNATKIEAVRSVEIFREPSRGELLSAVGMRTTRFVLRLRSFRRSVLEIVTSGDGDKIEKASNGVSI
jgi:hypothetical protein